MFLPDLVVRSRRTVLATTVRPAALHIRHGKIIGVMDFDDVPDGCPRDDAEGLALMPGVIDTHVHVNATDGATPEAFEAATQAAAAGGVTSIIDMAAATTASELVQKQDAATGRCFVDVGFWGGIANGNAAELAALSVAGVRGFRCALAASSVERFPAVTEEELRAALKVVAKLGAQWLVHAQRPGPIDRAAKNSPASGGWLSRLRGFGRSIFASPKYAAYLASRPKEAENEGIALAINLCREYRVKTHILHLSSSDALTSIYHARASRLPLSVETCPHYLTVAAEDIPDGATAFQTDPPIRERANREYLWASLAGGVIQLVASDHPHVSTVDRSLATTWKEASARGYSLIQLVNWMCRAPAALAGLDRKGAIDVGFDADLTVWDPERHVIERTYVRGVRVYERGVPPRTRPGQLLIA